MDYINIISSEPIMTVPNWTFLITLVLPICMILSSVIYFRVTKNQDKTLKYLLSMFIIALIFEIMSIYICDRLFQIPTGRCKYQATINKDKITVTEYEEFLEKYNPTIENGVYYWEE